MLNVNPWSSVNPGAYCCPGLTQGRIEMFCSLNCFMCFCLLAHSLNPNTDWYGPKRNGDKQPLGALERPIGLRQVCEEKDVFACTMMMGATTMGAILALTAPVILYFLPLLASKALGEDSWLAWGISNFNVTIFKLAAQGFTALAWGVVYTAYSSKDSNEDYKLGFHCILACGVFGTLGSVCLWYHTFAPKGGERAWFSWGSTDEDEETSRSSNTYAFDSTPSTRTGARGGGRDSTGTDAGVFDWFGGGGGHRRDRGGAARDSTGTDMSSENNPEEGIFTRAGAWFQSGQGGDANAGKDEDEGGWFAGWGQGGGGTGGSGGSEEEEEQMAAERRGEQAPLLRDEDRARKKKKNKNSGAWGNGLFS